MLNHLKQIFFIFPWYTISELFVPLVMANIILISFPRKRRQAFNQAIYPKHIQISSSQLIKREKQDNIINVGKFYTTYNDNVQV